jgi:hypothetical protein
MFNISLPNTCLFEKKLRFNNSQLKFSEFQQLKNKYAKYILCCALVIVTQCFSIFKRLYIYICAEHCKNCSQVLLCDFTFREKAIHCIIGLGFS